MKNNMTKYKVLYGSGTAWLNEEIVEVDEPTTDYGAILNIAIDQIEARGEENAFITLNDTVEYGGKYYEDEYVIGGNHGRLLLHHGELNIVQIN